MADKHPYVSAPGGLVQVITHFRKSIPATVTAETLRKLGYAPKNESYVLNVLRHLEMIDDQSSKWGRTTVFDLSRCPSIGDDIVVRPLIP